MSIRVAFVSVKFVSFCQILIFDGGNGERVSSLGGEKAHKGGIYAVSLAPCHF